MNREVKVGILSRLVRVNHYEPRYKKGLIRVYTLEKRDLSSFLEKNPIAIIKGKDSEVRYILSDRMRSICKLKGFHFEDDLMNDVLKITSKEIGEMILKVDYYYEFRDKQFDFHMEEIILLYPEKENKTEYDKAFRLIHHYFLNDI